MGGVVCTLFRELQGRRSFLAMPRRRRSARSCSSSSNFVAGQPAVRLSHQLTLNDEDVLARLDVFRDEQSTRLLLGELEMCRKNGDVAGVARIAERVRARLFDLSAFMKELKLRMTLAYNYATGRTCAL